MAGKKAGKWVRVFIEGYDLTTDLTSVPYSNTGQKVDVGGYTQDMSYLIARRDGVIVLDGFFNEDTNRTHTALKTLAEGNVSHLVSEAIGDNALPTVGDMTLHLSGAQATYLVNPDLSAAVAVNAEYAAKGTPVEYGKLLADATITANGNQASVDNAASSANGGVGYLHITALSAGDTITVLIEDSADDAAWATLITFTLDGTALDAERLTVSGTVDRYVRASYTVTGATISFPIAVGFIRS